MDIKGRNRKWWLRGYERSITNDPGLEEINIIVSKEAYSLSGKSLKYISYESDSTLLM